MRTAIAALIAIAVLGGAPARAADALPKCLSKREARVMWPAKHLYWINDGNGRRCWTDRRGGRARLMVPPIPDQSRNRTLPPRRPPEAEPLRTPLPNIPPEWVPQLPQATVTFPPPAPFDDTWIHRTAPAEIEPPKEQTIYSTFTGPPPDVWPELKPRRQLSHDIGLLAIALMAGFAFLAGLFSRGNP
jgi:hypothetical protein